MKKPPAPAEPVDRTRRCMVCGASYGTEGALPYACDWHLVAGAMAMTCSPGCRRARGYPERKPLAEVGG